MAAVKLSLSNLSSLVQNLIANGVIPLPHSSTHESGGDDEINVADLSGLLADAQRTAATPGSYTNVNITVDADGVITSILDGTPPIISPTTFDFTDVTGQARGVVISSNTITVAGDTSTVWAFAVRGNSSQLSINGGAWATEGIARHGDTIQIRMTSSSSPSTATVAYLYCNGLTVDWSVTTAAFLPTDIAGLKLWLASDAGITKDGSDKVSAWADQSGNGNNVTQATGTAQPLWVANAIGSIPTIRFDGTTDVMTIPSITYKTIFAVIKSSGATFADYDGVIGGAAHVLSGESGTTKMDRGTLSFTNCYRNGGSALSFSSGYQMSPINTYFLITATYSTGITQAGTLGQISGGGRFWNGDMMAILIYDSVLSAPDLASVNSYLMTKYGL